MNTPSPEIQISAAGRRHARYSDEFKRPVVAACGAPGISKAAITLANGLKANMLRRWVVHPHSGHGLGQHADGQTGQRCGKNRSACKVGQGFVLEGAVG